LAALLTAGCFGAKAELQRRGISIDEDELVARATSSDAEVVALLLKAGVAVDGLNTHGSTALLVAGEVGSVEVARLLFAAGANPNLSPPTLGGLPLASAAGQGHRELVGLLLENGAKLELKAGAQEMTPLAMAAFGGHEDIVTDLLAAGADIDSTDAAGWTPLHHAVREGDADVIQVLLEAGADPQVVDNDGWSPWEIAKSAGRWTIATQLETHMADQARRKRAPGSVRSPLAIPPDWLLFDPFDEDSSYWPEHTTFSTTGDPPGSYRILLRSPKEEEAQIFLILSRAGPWWDRYRDTVNELESSPLLEDSQVYSVDSVDGVTFKLRRYRLGKGALTDKRVERVLGLGETRDGQILILDAGGSPDAAGLARIDGVLTHSRILDGVGAMGAL
jgi:ankyrin repeat protein